MSLAQLFEALTIKEIGIVKFGEPDFKFLIGGALVFIAFALITIFTIKEAQQQRKEASEEAAATASEVSFSGSVSSAPSVAAQFGGDSSPAPTTKRGRSRTPSKARATPKKEGKINKTLL